jgi:hypothetical protein
MITPASPSTTRLTPWWGVMLIALGLLVAGALLHAATWSTDPWEGMKSELANLPRILLFGSIFLFPLGLILSLGLRLFDRQKYRTWTMLAPFVYMLLLPVFDWPTASNRQQHFTQRALPQSAREMQTHFTGSSLEDYSLTYYFKCDPAETDAFIRDLKLEATSAPEADKFVAPPFSGWPDPLSWEEPVVFSLLEKYGNWIYCLKTERTRQQVYFSIRCVPAGT